MAVTASPVQQLQTLVNTESLDRQYPEEEEAAHRTPDLAQLPNPRPGSSQMTSRPTSNVLRPDTASRSSSPLPHTPRPYLLPAPFSWSPPKMTPYTEDEDIEHYLRMRIPRGLLSQASGLGKVGHCILSPCCQGRLVRPMWQWTYLTPETMPR